MDRVPSRRPTGSSGRTQLCHLLDQQILFAYWRRSLRLSGLLLRGILVQVNVPGAITNNKLCVGDCRINRITCQSRPGGHWSDALVSEVEGLG